MYREGGEEEREEGGTPQHNLQAVRVQRQLTVVGGRGGRGREGGRWRMRG